MHCHSSVREKPLSVVIAIGGVVTAMQLSFMSSVSRADRAALEMGGHLAAILEKRPDVLREDAGRWMGPDVRDNEKDLS